MLYAEQLDLVVKKLLGPFFKGVYSINTLPKHSHQPFCLIFNSDPSYKNGEHWMAICLPPNKRAGVLFIEPMGLPLHKLLNNGSISAYLSSVAAKTHTLPFPLQCIWSTACGHYCAFVLTHLPLYDYNLTRLAECEFLEENHAFNDVKVRDWWERAIKTDWR